MWSDNARERSARWWVALPFLVVLSCQRTPSRPDAAAARSVPTTPRVAPAAAATDASTITTTQLVPEAPAADASAAARVPPPDVPLVAPVSPTAVVALRCETETECTDAAGRHYDCTRSEAATGRSTGRARSCTQSNCRGGSCPAVALLSGEVADSDQEESHKMPGAAVAVWPASGGSRVETTSDAEGRYHVIVPAGQTVFVRAAQRGFISELHGVTMPATGWDVTIDLRHAARLSALLGAASGVDPLRGVLAVEFIGPGELANLGAETVPPASASLVFDGNWQPARGNRLLPGGRSLQVLGGMSGSVRLVLVDSPSLRCAPQASGVSQWPVEPGTVTQVDVQCAAVAR